MKKLLNYEKFRSYCNMERFEEADYYNDILDGSTARNNLEDMKTRFEKLKESNVLVANCVMSNHLIMDFYDSAKLFDKANGSFYALVISFLTLPQTFRGKVGAGTFVVASHTISGDSNAERTLLTRLYRTELQLLRDGFRINIQDNNGVIIEHFVQVRINNHVMDTIGLQSLCRVQANNAKHGCVLCGGISGTYRHCLNKTCYMGHRALLEMNNILRWYGSSGKCCPKGYYLGEKDSEIEVKDLITSLHRKEVNENSVIPKMGSSKRNYKPGAFHACCKDIDKEMRSQDNATAWYHQNEFPFPETNFNLIISYPHLDLRDVVANDHITDDEYIRRAKVAIKSGTACEGIKGPWIYRDISKWDDLTWDAFHTLKNCFGNCLSLLKGIRGISNAGRMLCKAERTHCSVWYPSRTKDPVWKLSRKDMQRIDALMACISYPFGYSGSKVQNPFCQSGYLNGIQMINLFVIYMPTLLAFTSLKPEYRIFFAMIAFDVAELLSMRLSNDEIDELSKRIDELVALKEGLFPDSEALITWHQLTDLAPHIPRLGPIQCSWGTWGERAIGGLKRYNFY